MPDRTDKLCKTLYKFASFLSSFMAKLYLNVLMDQVDQHVTINKPHFCTAFNLRVNFMILFSLILGRMKNYNVVETKN